MSEQRKPAEVEGYEKLDAAPGPTTRAGIYLLAAMFLVAALVVPLYWLYARQETKAEPRPATVLKEQPAPGVFPRLLTSEPRALAEFRAREDAILNGYAWTEKDRGLVTMPIDEALRIVAGRGTLPAFEASTAAGAKAAATSDGAPGSPAPGGTR
jgi:hypothetical protein